jgi:hypothetical protein
MYKKYNRYTIWILLIASLIMLFPLTLYFITFFGTLSKNDQNWANFGAFLGGTISSIFAFANFIILFTNYVFEKIKINKERCIEYLKCVNSLNSDINHLMMDIQNIELYTNKLLIDDGIVSKLLPDNDFISIASKIREIQKYLYENRTKFDIINTNKKMYYDKILELADNILNPNIIINILTKFEDNACNYFHMIAPHLRDEYREIVIYVQNSSQGGMTAFNIGKFKMKILAHIKLINEDILEKKIKEKDLFD